MAVTLTLGGVVFQGFEVPDTIRTGGEQALVVHKLPGGSRTVDAMGADDADIPWAGRFRGAQAESRARILEGYRKSGQQLLLRWSTYRYRVVVQSFRCDYQQPFEIPYTISCLVVTDESAPALFGIPGLDEIVGSDIGNALGLSQSLGVAQIASAVNAAQQTIATAGTLRSAPTSTLLQISGALASATQATGAAITSASASAASATPVTAGGDPAAMAAGLTTQANAFGQLNQLYQLSGTLTRMNRNVTA